ncbi:MAG: hypothetical protein JNL79_12160 [Myxococcales bacterium]|nr:hypothetical protein [Myxococcales bacterium]
MNPWKISTAVLTCALGVTLGTSAIHTASAGDKKDDKKVEQPKMESALENLKKAKEDLEKALANKGGHRVTAHILVKQAINEVEAGIKFAEDAKDAKANKDKADKLTADFEICVKAGKFHECYAKFEEARAKQK